MVLYCLFLKSVSVKFHRMYVQIVFSYLPILINYLLTDGQTDKQTDRLGAAYTEITLNRSCNVFEFNPSKKNHSVPNACKKDGQIDLKHLF